MGVEEDCVNTVKTAIEKLGGLDIIIANAVSPTDHPLHSLIPDLLPRASPASPPSPTSPRPPPTTGTAATPST